MQIRSALGLYNKQGCGDVSEKMALITKPTAIVNDYLQIHPTRSNHVQEACDVLEKHNWSGGNE